MQCKSCVRLRRFAGQNVSVIRFVGSPRSHQPLSLTNPTSPLCWNDLTTQPGFMPSSTPPRRTKPREEHSTWSFLAIPSAVKTGRNGPFLSSGRSWVLVSQNIITQDADSRWVRGCDTQDSLEQYRNSCAGLGGEKDGLDLQRRVLVHRVDLAAKPFEGKLAEVLR